MYVVFKSSNTAHDLDYPKVGVLNIPISGGRIQRVVEGDGTQTPPVEPGSGDAIHSGSGVESHRVLSTNRDCQTGRNYTSSPTSGFLKYLQCHLSYT